MADGDSEDNDSNRDDDSSDDEESSNDGRVLLHALAVNKIQKLKYLQGYIFFPKR